jgi:hypothetical protein
MIQNNLEQIECLDFCNFNYLEVQEQVPSRWEIISKNADIPWQAEIPCTGENGNIVSSGCLRKRSQIYQMEEPGRN